MKYSMMKVVLVGEDEGCPGGGTTPTRMWMKEMRNEKSLLLNVRNNCDCQHLHGESFGFLLDGSFGHKNTKHILSRVARFCTQCVRSCRFLWLRGSAIFLWID
jgi:hypothetical protein